jgi:hypothetical protein
MATFSQRNGHTPLPQKMVPESISAELRNTLWNAIVHAIGFREYEEVTQLLWIRLYKLPVDSRPCTYDYTGSSWADSWHAVRQRILEGKWYETYDHVEFFAGYRPNLAPIFNKILEIEVAAYRVIGGLVCQITNESELAEVQSAMDHDDNFAPVGAHIKAAVQFLSDRTNPDYRNSIKESISAVESAAKIMTNEPNVELGKALGILETKGKINGALKKGFSAIYGWSSDQHGIRHGMMDESNLTQADAKLFLVMCSAFANYLKTVD